MEFSTLNGYKVKDKKAIRYYDTVNDMKNDTTLKNGMYVKTKGYYSANDGGHGEYIIINDDSLVDDGGFIHVLNNGLRAKLISNEINVLQFGAKNDGETDNTSIIQSVIDKCKLYNKTIYFPPGEYLISNTIKTYENISIILDNKAFILINDNVDGIYLDGNSIIRGGSINVNINNYSHTVITLLPANVTQDTTKIGGLYNVSINNKTLYSSDSVGIGINFTDNNNVYYEGITYESILNCKIYGFDYGTKFVSSESNEWVTSLNVDNLKMIYCKKFIYANMIKDFTGNKFDNIHIQVDKNNLDYVIYLNGKCEDNYFNVIEWDIDTALNQGCIYLGSNTLNNKLEMSKLFNYGTLKLISDNGKYNQITSPFINEKINERTNMKYIDLTGLDSTKAYPILFENMCDIKIWKKSQTGALYSYLYASIDAVSSLAGSMIGNYFARISTLPAEQLLPKIQANTSNRYIAVYLKGGYKYNFLDYNYQYQETNSVEYYYSPEYEKPYKIVTTSFTSGGITYTPIDTANSIPRGMYYDYGNNINLDKDSTPLSFS